MQDPRAHAAISRIERALQRLEAALPTQAPPDQSAELDRLRTAHATLRSRVEAAIGEIDRMIEPEPEAAG